MNQTIFFILFFALISILTNSQKVYEKKSINDNWTVNIFNCPTGANQP